MVRQSQPGVAYITDTYKQIKGSNIYYDHIYNCIRLFLVEMISSNLFNIVIYNDRVKYYYRDNFMWSESISREEFINKLPQNLLNEYIYNIHILEADYETVAKYLGSE